MPTIQDNHIFESQLLLKLSYEVENLDLGDRREKILKLFSKLREEILKPLDSEFFTVNEALKKSLIQQRHALRVKGCQEKELEPLTESIGVLKAYAKIEKVNDYKYFTKNITLSIFFAMALSAVFFLI